jgi:plastocyanin
MNNKHIITSIVLGVLVIAGAGIVVSETRNDESMDMNMGGSSMTDTTARDDMSQSKAAPNEIVYEDFAVVQKKITVKKGTTVTWINNDNAMHDVTPVNETAEFMASELFGKGETYSMTFDTVGTFDYFCSPHPYMKGTVEVTE